MCACTTHGLSRRQAIMPPKVLRRPAAVVGRVRRWVRKRPAGSRSGALTFWWGGGDHALHLLIRGGGFVGNPLHLLLTRCLCIFPFALPRSFH